MYHERLLEIKKLRKQLNDITCNNWDEEEEEPGEETRKSIVRTRNSEHLR